jgi:hypothetical protein
MFYNPPPSRRNWNWASVEEELELGLRRGGTGTGPPSRRNWNWTSVDEELELGDVGK